MRRIILVAALLLCIAPRLAFAATARRFALVAGANRGPSDRIPLRYAISDAEGFAGVVQRLGGVAPTDCVVLREPGRAAFLAALGTLRARVMAARGEAARTEVILYYSGHADDQGLLLGREVIGYRELRAALGDLAADVNIAVLDACASGAITRLKGGQAHPAFLSDVSTQMQGYAFLTSSSENEAAQESERIQSSYFTHALLSGLRGAADASGDGRITLNEAYQFAFAETLAQTTPTQGGAQHPTYDIKMSGTGEVVMTDVRRTSAALLLGPELEGRFFVRNSRQELVAELHKPAGRTIELGLDPGRYEVAYERESAFLGSRVTIEPGQRRALMRQELSPRRRFTTRSRGGFAPPRSLALRGRSRIEMRGGISEGRVTVGETAGTENVNVVGGQFAMSGLHWLREDLAVELSAQGIDLSQRVLTGEQSQTSETDGVMAVLFGARYYVPVGALGAPLRPYVGLALGPHSDIHSRSTTSSDSGASTSEFATAKTNLGLRLSGGADVQIGRHMTLGLYSGASLRGGMRTRLGVGFSMGWTVGRGRW